VGRGISHRSRSAGHGRLVTMCREGRDVRFGLGEAVDEGNMGWICGRNYQVGAGVGGALFPLYIPNVMLGSKLGETPNYSVRMWEGPWWTLASPDVHARQGRGETQTVSLLKPPTLRKVEEESKEIWISAMNGRSNFFLFNGTGVNRELPRKTWSSRSSPSRWKSRGGLDSHPIKNTYNLVDQLPIFRCVYLPRMNEKKVGECFHA
jgi:hypothetical protein